MYTHNSYCNTALIMKLFSLSHSLGFTSGQLSQLEDNSELIEQREREILSVVRSISEINEMYKDLATMVVEQVRIIEGGREGETNYKRY